MTDIFSSLKPYQARRFVPPEFQPDDWPQVERLLDRLEATVADPGSNLRDYLLAEGELADVVEEEVHRRYVRKSCDTENAALRDAFMAYVGGVLPRYAQRSHRLNLLYMKHPGRAALPAQYRMFDLVMANQVELHRDENIALAVEESRIVASYDELTGAQTAPFEGREQTLAALGVALEDPDRDRRRAAFDAVTERRLLDREKFENIFDSLLRLRHRMATNAGFANFRDYTFRAKNRFDYAPADCFRFHDAVEEAVMPLFRRLDLSRRARLGVERLRPWDVNVDPRGRASLRPCADAGDLVAGCGRVFHRIDPVLGGYFDELAEAGTLDLSNRPGKAPGGFQTKLSEARFPFIFMNAVGTEDDVRTLLHEAGHAFHTFETRHYDIPFNRHYPIEFGEVASTSMEYIGADFVDTFYAGEDLARARRVMFERGITILPRVALVDAFQHWLYTTPDHTPQERRRQWLALNERFTSGVVDWSGYEEALAASWHRIMHFFHVPLYFIEYGFAGVGAFQVWRNWRRDPARAIAAYRAGLALGHTRPLPDLYAAAGVAFDFSPRVLREVCDFVEEEMNRLEPAEPG
ncbi:MAG: M3 family oligoendopeptidase [Planctomycetes bacterium]|nr:M3 family oligoendopeptidase [Planctomycetota bacterium]